MKDRSKCSSPHCNAAIYEDSLCQKHYSQINNKPYFSICSIDKCSRKVKAKDLCPLHYSRLYRHGNAQMVLVDRSFGSLSLRSRPINRFKADRDTFEHRALSLREIQES